MGNFIPEEIIQEIQRSNDIVDVISEYLTLKKKGKYFVGLCPFHLEDTPSFSVTPDKQIFYCFGCNAGGNVIKFIMEKEKLNFPDAIRFLGRRAGVTIPEGGNNTYQDKAAREREKAFQVNKLAKDFYHYLLNNKEVGLAGNNYLVSRNLTKETIESFQLGYAPPNWDALVTFLNKKGYSNDYLSQIGLIIQKNSGSGYYDRFRNRVMFPIWDEKNRVIGFGGRVLDTSLPKYLNSSESIIFNKGSILYGLNFALDAIREADQVIIMEGYLDVITAHQNGVKNTVASLGTALTKEHGKLIKRYTNQVIFAYDADQAGISAALRGMEILQEQGFIIKVVTVPQGKDPDEFISHFGPQAFIDLISEKSISLIEFKLNMALKKQQPNDAVGKIKLLNTILPDIAKTNNAILKDEYIKIVSSMLKLSWEMVNSELTNFIRNQYKTTQNRDKIAKNRNNIEGSAQDKYQAQRPVLKNQFIDVEKKAELALLKIIINNPKWRMEIKSKIGWDSFKEPLHRNLLFFIDKNVSESQACKSADLINLLEDENLISILSQLEILEDPAEDLDKVVEDCINLILNTSNQSKKDNLLKALSEAEAAKDVNLQLAILKELQQLL